MLIFHPGNPIGSREATHEQIVELRNDGNSGSPKEIIEDETIHNQIVVEGKKTPIKKEVLKPKPEEADGNIKQVVEENHSIQAEQSDDSVLPIIYNVSTIDDKLKHYQGAVYISSLLFYYVSYIHMDTWIWKINTDHVECHVTTLKRNGFRLQVDFCKKFVDFSPQPATLVLRAWGFR